MEHYKEVNLWNFQPSKHILWRYGRCLHALLANFRIRNFFGNPCNLNREVPWLFVGYVSGYLPPQERYYGRSYTKVFILEAANYDDVLPGTAAVTYPSRTQHCPAEGIDWWPPEELHISHFHIGTNLFPHILSPKCYCSLTSSKRRPHSHAKWYFGNCTKALMSPAANYDDLLPGKAVVTYPSYTQHCSPEESDRWPPEVLQIFRLPCRY